MTSRQALAQHPVVFEGVPVDYRGRWFSNEVDWAIEVDRMLKGPPADVLVVRSHAHSATCGYVFRIGERYRIHAGTWSGRLNTGLCSANALLAGGPGPSAARDYFSPWPFRLGAAGVLGVLVALVFAVRALRRGRTEPV